MWKDDEKVLSCSLFPKIILSQIFYKKTDGVEREKMKKLIVGVFWVVFLTASLHASLTGFLNTPDGLYSGDDGWSHSEGGVRVSWTITQNGSIWHYEYAFSKSDGTPLTKDTSHFIIELSENIQAGDLYNFTGDIDGTPEFGTFEPGNENPGFPVGESIFGVKINMGGDQLVVGFDCTRSPMWGDFYAKDGVSHGLWNFAYNTDLGVAVANPNDYLGIPLDGEGNMLYKVLVPDTIPEPTTLAMFGLGCLALLRKRRV